MKKLFALILTTYALLTGPFAYSQPLAYSNDEEVLRSHPDWMARVPGDTRINDLSIPGTHDSLALWGVFTQAKSLASQLEAGIRSFDMGAVVIDGRLHLISHTMYQKVIFHEVLDTLGRFLRAHHAETVFLRVSRDPGTPDPEGAFPKAFASYVENATWHSLFWLRGHKNPEIPTLDQVRGKIVLFQGEGLSELPYGYVEGPLSSPPMDIEPHTVFRSNWDQYRKWTDVKAHLIKAQKQWLGNKFFMTDLTAHGGSFPFFVASGNVFEFTQSPLLLTGTAEVAGFGPYADFPRHLCVVFLRICSIAFEGQNHLTTDYIVTARPTYVGIVRADFPGPGLIEAVIALNLQRQAPVVIATGNGRCLHRSGDANENNEADIRVVVRDCGAAPVSAQWEMSSDGLVRSVHDRNRCLIMVNTPVSLPEVVVSDCRSVPFEIWSKSDDGTMHVRKFPSQCLTDRSGLPVSADNHEVVMSDCLADATSQVWRTRQVATALVSAGIECLQPQGPRPGAGSFIEVVDCRGDAAPTRWSLAPDHSVHLMADAALCLQMAAGLGDGVDITLAACNGGRSQQWTARGDMTLRPVSNPRLCVGPAGDRIRTDGGLGALAQVSHCIDGHAGQRFGFTAAPVTFRWNDAMCITVDSPAVAPRLVSRRCSPDGTNHRWTFRTDQTLRPDGNDTRCMAIVGNAAKTGARLTTAACSGQSAQRFVSRADASLRPADQPGLCVDVLRTNTSEGVPLQLYPCDDGNKGQRWTIQ